VRTLRIGERYVEVGEIGVGCAQLRRGGTHWAPLIRRAFERGANVFDTSEMYGASEEVLGHALAGIPRDRYVLATKVMQPFTAEHVRSAVVASCRRLRTDYLDLYLLHNPPAVSDEVWETLDQLTRQGVIGAYGSSLDLSHEALAHLARSPRPVLEMLLHARRAAEPRRALAAPRTKRSRDWVVSIC
jgi:1-deoxyxylulose-5-phosphate synthase